MFVSKTNSERIKLRLLDGKEEDLPWWKIGDFEILEKAEESIFQRVMGIGLTFVLGLEWIMIMIIGSIGLGLLTIGSWIKDRFKRRR